MWVAPGLGQGRGADHSPPEQKMTTSDPTLPGEQNCRNSENSRLLWATAALVAVAMSGFVWGLYSRDKVNPDLLRTTGHGNLAAFPAPSAAPPDLNELVRLSIVFIRK